MTKIPEPMHQLVGLIDAHHESQQSHPRGHLGCSLLGHPCDRWLWLSFRWAVQEQFPGRVLRLFRRGHNEERTIISDLRAIGVDIRDTFNGRQRKVDFGAHVSGSIDGIIEKGLPEAPKSRHIAEFKTHSKKSFDDLVKNGVEKSKPQHYVQMQVYMHGTNIRKAVYIAVCKDDDRLYSERIELNKEVAEKYIARGRRIALDARMPPPVSTDPTWYQCKFCPAYSLCHEKAPTKFANCRTCAHSTPTEASTWRCERHDADGIPEDFQRTGCDDHVIHPDLVPWEYEGSEDGLHVTWLIDGKRILNGPNGYKSREIVANPAACGSEQVEAVKAIFPDTEVVG